MSSGLTSAKIAVNAKLTPVEVVKVNRGVPKLGIQPSVVLRWNGSTYNLRPGDTLQLDVNIDSQVST